jgi:O-antigen/teichoic acid export membrane protein
MTGEATSLAGRLRAGSWSQPSDVRSKPDLPCERDGLAADATVRRIAGTFATKLIAISLSVPFSVILARALGPEGRGEFVAATAVASLGMQLGNLGLHSANTFFVSRDAALLSALSINSAIVGTVLGGLIALLFYAVRASGLFLGDLDHTYFLIALIWIPVGLGQMLQHNLMAGLQRFAVFNKVDVGVRAGNLLLCSLLCVIGIASPVPYTLAVIVVLAASYCFCLWYIERQRDRPARPRLDLLRRQLPYGLKTFVVSLFAFLVVRSDVMILKHLSGSRETGVYSVAVSLVDMLYLLPTAVGVVLFPALSAPGTAEDRWRVVRAALLHTGWIIGAGVALLFIWGNPIIGLLFGRDFLGAYPMMVVLAVAMLFYGLNNVVSVYLSATGLPWFGVWVWLLAFGVNLGLNLLWIPRFGGVGAAWASLVSYAALFVLQFTYIISQRAGEAPTELAGAEA